MSSKLRNIFFLFGVVSIMLMIFGFDLSLEAITNNLLKAGWWFVWACILWFVVYVINAFSWYTIIHDGSTQSRISFWRIIKFTISGFALNAVTPVGLMGGEPYRIMELKAYVGIEKATSSTLLYTMMHIFSHFWFWLFSVALYLILYSSELNLAISSLLLITVLVCVIAIYFFMKGYRSGFTYSALCALSRLPLVGKWANRICTEQRESLNQIDQQIAMLHQARRTTFYTALGCEFCARVLSSVELIIFLYIFDIQTSLWDAVLMLGFTSLFANALFFLPMQLGAREGGFAMAANGLSLTAGIGVSMALLIRLRELVCIAIGLLLIKIGNKSK
ncbi:MAG: flippase-like domain-containing protein [Bacteroidaceae bacterium]|nr:flippase-like domain-containing protein [Bacteroidaceae bacterium]